MRCPRSRDRQKRLANAWLVGMVVLLLATAAEASRSSDTTDGQPAGAGDLILVTFEQRASWRAPRAGTSGMSHPDAYKPSARTRRLVARVADAYALEEVDSWLIRPLDVHCVVFEPSPGDPIEELVARLADDPRIESVQPMQRFEVQTQSYNDPYLELQHGVDTMQVQEAHRWALGAGVRIAVVDTGVDLDHPELLENIQLAEDFVTRGGDFPPDRHGTAVAGVIASSVDNGIGIVGVAPAAEILALRACWQDRQRAGEGVCNSFTLAKALSFAIERRPDIINLSLAGPPDPLLERLVGEALSQGAIVIAAAGERPEEAFPASMDGVFGVRTSPAQAPSGRASQSRVLFAPGNEILTTVPAGGFDFLSGSSLASAHVSGVAALLLERRPQLTGAEVFALLSASTAGRGGEVAPAKLPAGLAVNACAALSRLVPKTNCDRPVVRPAAESVAPLVSAAPRSEPEQ